MKVTTMFVCQACWNRENPGRKPERLPGVPLERPCGICGTRTKSDIVAKVSE